ncbi:MAG: DUF3991 and toprim domain-containing protein [Treponema sp.]|nr:DUF3991 and toprim domain-containing protein [Treponema sp.]
MPRVSEEQVRQARKVGLLAYLQANEPHELVKSSRNEYRTKTHSSLVISNGLFYWNRGGVGGRSAIDFLIKIRGMGFADAVETVLNARAPPAFSAPPAEKRNPSTQPAKAEFKLPETAKFPANAVSYLQKRGISPEIISRCLELGIIAETKKYRNVMFVGRDENGTARFACLRGTKGDFKSDAPGSSKKYSFCLPAASSGSRHLVCFESPIAALSHASLQKRGGWDWDGHRLSLGGTSSVGLVPFLERNPQITRVVLHLDNDAAGISAARKIKAQLGQDARFKHISVSANPPRGAKDYNGALLRDIRMERERKTQKHPNRRQADFLL